MKTSTYLKMNSCSSTSNSLGASHRHPHVWLTTTMDKLTFAEAEAEVVKARSKSIERKRRRIKVTYRKNPDAKRPRGYRRTRDSPILDEIICRAPSDPEELLGTTADDQPGEDHGSGAGDKNGENEDNGKNGGITDVKVPKHRIWTWKENGKTMIRIAIRRD